MYSYIYKGKKHTDTTRSYMVNLGMEEDAIESVLKQKDFEESQYATLRATAYKCESDPLYIEWQYELEVGNPKADDFKKKWIDKVAEIKKRYPASSGG